MTFWIRKINWVSVLVSAFIYTVVAMIVHGLEAAIMMRYYVSPIYFGVWSKLMMPSAGPPPPEFFLVSLIITFVSGICLALIYYYVQDLLPKKFWHRVTFFADLMIATSFVFSPLPSFLLFNLPWQLLVSWFVASFVIVLAASYTFVKLIK